MLMYDIVPCSPYNHHITNITLIAENELFGGITIYFEGYGVGKNVNDYQESKAIRVMDTKEEQEELLKELERKMKDSIVHFPEYEEKMNHGHTG